MNAEVSDDLLFELMPKVEVKLLAQLPEPIPTHRFTWRFEHKMRKIIKNVARSPQMRRIANYSKRAVLIIAALLIMTFGAVMSVEALRVRFFKLISQTFEKYTAIWFEKSANAPENIDIFIPYEITVIPKGFRISEMLYDPDAKWQDITYRNDAGNRISFEQGNLETMSISVNTEGVSLEKTEINGCEAYYFSNIGMQSVYWFDDTYFFMITSDLDKNMVLKLAESTKDSKQ